MAKLQSGVLKWFDTVSTGYAMPYIGKRFGPQFRFLSIEGRGWAIAAAENWLRNPDQVEDVAHRHLHVEQLEAR